MSLLKIPRKLPEIFQLQNKSDIIIVEQISNIDHSIFIGKNSNKTSATIKFRKINEETISLNKINKYVITRIAFIFNDGDKKLYPAGDRIRYSGKTYNRLICNNTLKEMLLSTDESAATMAYDLLKYNHQQLSGNILLK